jgi:hypothetical protein
MNKVIEIRNAHGYPVMVSASKQGRQASAPVIKPLNVALFCIYVGIVFWIGIEGVISVGSQIVGWIR